MKSLLTTIALFTMFTNANASLLIMCSSEAQLTCKELKDKNEFINCYQDILKACMEENEFSKAMQSNSCENFCANIPETTSREICLRNCQNN